MDSYDPTSNHGQAGSKDQPKQRPGTPERHASPTLTRGQRWLAFATAGAVLLSGLNALVQVWKVVVECCGRHW